MDGADGLNDPNPKTRLRARSHAAENRWFNHLDQYLEDEDVNKGPPRYSRKVFKYGA